MATPSTSPDPELGHPVIDPKEARAAINRENAQHSTGPRTAEGKQRVRLNALKHGIYSKTILVPDSEKEAYEHEAELLETRYRPGSDMERELVQTLHEHRWRMSSAIAAERNLLRLVEDQQLESIDQIYGEQDEDTRRALAQAAGIQANARLFDQISRHIARLDRIMDRTQREIVYLIGHRIEQTQRRKATEQSQPTRPKPPVEIQQMPTFTGSLKEFKRKQWLRQQEKRNNGPEAA